jgi:VWFA-related protein
VNVILLDTAFMPIDIQMSLNFELTSFLKGLSADKTGQLPQPFAIYLKRGDDRVLLQEFTTDRAPLTAAFQQGIPWLHALGGTNDDPIHTLNQVAQYLKVVTGRKNLLWFSGGMSLPQIAPGIAAAPTATRMRPPYDKLEANRIALYPMDARGLTLTSNYGLHEQYWVYDDIAKATGGQAFYARNNIAAAITRTIEADRNFYTPTYTPNPFTTANSWHTVAIEVAGQSYTVS